MSAVILEDPPIDATTKASRLEEMIEKCLQHPTDDKAFIDKLALAPSHDPRVRGVCRKRAFENGVDLKRVEEVIQRVMDSFLWQNAAEDPRLPRCLLFDLGDCRQR